MWEIIHYLTRCTRINLFLFRGVLKQGVCKSQSTKTENVNKAISVDIDTEWMNQRMLSERDCIQTVLLNTYDNEHNRLHWNLTNLYASLCRRKYETSKDITAAQWLITLKFTKMSIRLVRTIFRPLLKYNKNRNHGKATPKLCWVLAIHIFHNNIPG